MYFLLGLARWWGASDDEAEIYMVRRIRVRGSLCTKYSSESFGLTPKMPYMLDVVDTIVDMAGGTERRT